MKALVQPHVTDTGMKCIRRPACRALIVPEISWPHR